MADCKFEAKETKFGEPCKKGYTFCLEERCPDFKPKCSGCDRGDE